MPTKRIINARNRAVVLGSVVALYVLTTVFFLLRVNQYTQDIYDYPYTVSSQARIMQSRLYDFRSILPVVFASTDLAPEDIKSTLESQEALQKNSIKIIEKKYRGGSEELSNLKEALSSLQAKRRELIEMTRQDPTVVSIITRYSQIVEPAFVRLDDALDIIADGADKRGQEIHEHADKIIVYIVVFTIVFGLFLIFFIYSETNEVTRWNKRILQREKLLNLLCASVNDVYIIFTRTGEPEFVSANTKAILGINHTNILKDKNLFFQMLNDKDNEWLQKCLTDSAASSFAPRTVELRGSSRSYKLHVYPMRAGESSWFVVSLVDETEQIQYQRTLGDALQSAQNASRAKSQFLSHMSHEIRTPMNAIIGMTTIALAKLDNKERVRDCLTKTMQASRHLLGLINDILDMSKIESNKLVLSQEPFNLKDAIHNLMNLVDPQAKSKGVNFEVTMSGVKHESFVGDALRTNQILINILANAIKFTPEGGSVRMRMFEKATSPSRVRLKFEISDTGIGMDEEFLQRAFLPFEQASGDISKKFGGSGLGLAITYNLVSLMGGTIFAKSELGKGSTFTVDIPFGLTDESAEHDEGLRELKALVVDDDKDTCEHACLLLGQLGQKTEFALSGREGIEKIKQSLEEGDPFDVCFLDWKMPEMDGEETACKIREIVGPETLIIIISAYDWSPIEKRAREAGVNGFIAKPFFTSSFYDCLKANDVNRKNETEKQATQPAHHPTIKKRILLAEDNVFNAEVAEEFLDMAGYEVEVQTNGKKAFEAFEQRPTGYYDLIFMDIQMPEMNGLEATRKIRQLDRKDAKEIPIVAMTANAFSEDISISLEAGMNDHISKPLELKRLYQVLGKYLGTDPKNKE